MKGVFVLTRGFFPEAYVKIDATGRSSDSICGFEAGPYFLPE
jgi:hypothetical protein